MPVTRRSDLVLPEVLMEAIQGEFPGMTALYGTPAATINLTLPGGVERGDTVKVPYFGNLGELEDMPLDEGESIDADVLPNLTVQRLTQTSETAIVRHSGKAFETSTFAQLVSAPGSDPITEAARQMRIIVQRRADKALIEEAETSTLTRNVYDDTTPVSLTWSEIEDAKGMFGDELEDIAGIAVRSEVYTELKKQVDANGRPLVYSPERQGELATLGGVPIIVSDRLTKTTEPAGAGSSTSYTSLLLKRNSLVFWMNGTPNILQEPDILSDSQVLAVHVYWACHMYSRLPGSTKPGVVKITHNL